MIFLSQKMIKFQILPVRFHAKKVLGSAISPSNSNSFLGRNVQELQKEMFEKVLINSLYIFINIIIYFT